MTTLLVNEIFGPVWQGEGPQRGQRAVFVRLATCNLACKWCDTPYAVFYDKRKADLHDSKKVYDVEQESHRMHVTEVVGKVRELARPDTLVVISGGEPLLQSLAVGSLCRVLYLDGYPRIAIETAGTRSIRPVMNALGESVSSSISIIPVVSPKLANSGNSLRTRYNRSILTEFANFGCFFKFVVQETSDFEEIERIIQQCGLLRKQVWIMPEGRTPQQVLENAIKIEEEVRKHEFNFTLRDHILLYGERRGV